MAEAARRRRRWPLVVAAGLAIAMLFGAWQLRSEKLARTILDRVGPALGLELSFEGTPSYTLGPEPTLTLPGFVARQPGADVPLLTADRLEVSLPWETIRGAEAREITRIELDAPVLDLAALAAWQATRPQDEPFVVPTLTQGLAVEDGTVVADGWRLSGVDVALPALRDGGPADAAVAGTLERGELRVGFEGDAAFARAGLVSPLRLDLAGTLALAADDTPMPWTLALDGDFDAEDDPLTITADAARATGAFAVGDGKQAAWTLDAGIALAVAETVALDLLDAVFRGDEPLPELHFDGHVVSASTLRLDAGGALARWPGGWPTLPPPLSPDVAMPFVLGYDGPGDFTAPLRLRLQRGGTRLDLRAIVPEVLAWMDRDDASPLPPVDGTFDTPELVVGAFTLDGVHVDFEDGAPIDGEGAFANVRGSAESTEPVADPSP